MSVTAGHLPVSVVDILALISLDRLEITRIDAKSRSTSQEQKRSTP